MDQSVRDDYTPTQEEISGGLAIYSANKQKVTASIIEISQSKSRLGANRRSATVSDVSNRH